MSKPKDCEVVVIRFEGRIVAVEEVHSLRLEIDKFQLETKKLILQLADVDCWHPSIRARGP
jgi:hypothetical protein